MMDLHRGIASHQKSDIILSAEVHILDTWRCAKCQRILAKVALKAGSVVEVKCRCNAINIFKAA